MANAFIDLPDFRASLWAIPNCRLVVVGRGSLIDLGISYFVAVPVGQFITSLLVSLPCVRPPSLRCCRVDETATVNGLLDPGDIVFPDGPDPFPPVDERAPMFQNESWARASNACLVASVGAWPMASSSGCGTLPGPRRTALLLKSFPA